jgi:hypothetical protein
MEYLAWAFFVVFAFSVGILARALIREALWRRRR